MEVGRAAIALGHATGPFRNSPQAEAATRWVGERLDETEEDHDTPQQGTGIGMMGSVVRPSGAFKRNLPEGSDRG